MSKRRILVIQEPLLVMFVGPIYFIELKRVFFHWRNSDSVDGTEMLFQCLSTNAEQIRCVLKIVFKFMIT